MNSDTQFPPCFANTPKQGDVVILIMSGHEPILGAYEAHDFASVSIKNPVIIVQQANPSTRKIDFALAPFGAPLLPAKKDLVRKFNFNTIIQIDDCSEKGITDAYVQAMSGIQRAPAGALDRLGGKTGVPR